MKTGDLIMLGLVAVGAYLIYTNWASISGAIPALASTTPTPAIPASTGGIVPASAPLMIASAPTVVPQVQTSINPYGILPSSGGIVPSVPVTLTPAIVPASTPPSIAVPVNTSSAFPLTTAALASAPAGSLNNSDFGGAAGIQAQMAGQIRNNFQGQNPATVDAWLASLVNGQVELTAQKARA